MAIVALIYTISIFLIGRNVISLILKIKDLLNQEKRVEFNESKSMYFLYGALILTAVLGIAAGIGFLFPNQIFPYYLFLIVSGMMIYSYISYAGTSYESKNWIMFVVSILVIILIIILVIILSIYMASGIID